MRNVTCLPRSAAATVALLAGLATACFTNPFEGEAPDRGDARLAPLPLSVPDLAAPTGTLPLGLGGTRDGVLFVPASYDPSTPTPMALLLHGATGSGSTILTSHQQLADSLGIIILAPDSRVTTWDAIFARFDYDIEFIDLALADVVSRYNVDRARVGVIGFSDGASYAFALGQANGDIFTKVVLHSPGIRFAVDRVGKPAFYIAHGTQDAILPVFLSRDSFVPYLKWLDYEVQFHEWNGPHAMSLARIRESLIWLASK